MRKHWPVLLFVLVLSCVPVTINVYFPETQIENVASEIENEVRSAEETTSDKDVSWRVPSWLAFFGAQEAYAQEISLNKDTPVIREIIERRKKRFDKIDDLLTKGFIGEGKDALLKEKNRDVLELKDLAVARKQVKEENADRTQLYKELVKENNIPSDQLSKIQEIFAKENRKQLKPGQFYQDDEGEWQEKKEAKGKEPKEPEEE